MPDIKLRNQVRLPIAMTNEPFDLAFHPNESVIFSSLLTGEVKAWRYDDENGSTSSSWSVRPSKRTARALAVEESGKHIWMGGKSGTLFQLTTEMGTIVREQEKAHDVPINRVFCVNENLIASGDDDGIIKLWDPRKQDVIREYNQHFDYISDFTYFEDKRQLVSTSGDGHLSVIDIRSNKAQPLTVSADQEDELLSIVQIKGGQKAIVGSGLGILSIWNRKLGWGDSVDRIPGHPASIDAIVALTPDIIATGSEDGMIRVLQVLPHKFLGVIASHEEYPIERIKLDRNSRWLGSVSHDECLKLTDVSDLFEDSDGEGEDEEEDEDEETEQDEDDDGKQEEQEGGEEADSDSDEEMEVEQEKPKKKKKKGKGGLGDLGRGGAEKENADFFADL
ncbi:WD repeat-containing protein JIP5 [Kwoniella mangroviensis CBS 8886]|nr:WD repeat-containing protein JIP5 [Kwoniella mangroviensis CBS 8507]OCF69581.1 WD repeat-containing protein JIP5 [Kwoniella mangroviensis CBS 8507]OCF70963.1 WD repeat-containing protein JIP5 [Kwoniella mangroviensis CBS 8886]